MASATVADDGNPWVAWMQPNEETGKLQPAFARMSDFSGFFVADPSVPDYKVMNESYHDLFTVLDEERDKANSIFNAVNPSRKADFVLRMCRTAVAMVLYEDDLHDDERLTNAEFCYMLGKSCLEVYEKGWNKKQGLHAHKLTWSKLFRRVIRQEWQTKLNNMSIRHALLLSHVLLLIVVQDKIETFERKHNRLSEPSIAERFAMRLLWTEPELYTRHVYELFLNGVYGRETVLEVILSMYD